MRASCQAIQKFTTAPAGEKIALEKAAKENAQIALRLWTGLVADFGTSIPDGYAGVPGWRQRLEDVHLCLARMQREIEHQEWRPAFLSCAQACNWIAAMHEENGVTLAIDAMTVLRKKTGVLKSLLASKKPERAQVVVKDILTARNQVLLAHPPAGPSRSAYVEGLPQLSRSVDRVCETAQSGGSLDKAVSELVALVERQYAWAIPPRPNFLDHQEGVMDGKDG